MVSSIYTEVSSVKSKYLVEENSGNPSVPGNHSGGVTLSSFAFSLRNGGNQVMTCQVNDWHVQHAALFSR